MTDILTHVFSLVEDHYRATRTNLEEIEVDAKEYSELTMYLHNSARFLYPPKPTPPVKGGARNVGGDP